MQYVSVIYIVVHVLAFLDRTAKEHTVLGPQKI